MLPGTGSSAFKHQPTSKAKSSRQTSSAELPGTGSSAAKHQPTSKAQSTQPTSTEPGTGSSAVKLSTSKHRPQSNRPSSTDRSMPLDIQDTGSPALHRARRTGLLGPSLRPVVTCPTDPHWTCIPGNHERYPFLYGLVPCSGH